MLEMVLLCDVGKRDVAEEAMRSVMDRFVKGNDFYVLVSDSVG